MRSEKMHLGLSRRALGVLAVVSLMGCKGGNETGAAPNAAPSAAAGSKKAKFTIGVSQCNLGEPWRVQMNADIKAAAAEHPEFEVTWRDAQNDTLKQRAQVEELAQAKVDVLIISPK